LNTGLQRRRWPRAQQGRSIRQAAYRPCFKSCEPSIYAVEATDDCCYRSGPARRPLSLTQSPLPAKPNRTCPAGREYIEGTVRRRALFIERPTALFAVRRGLRSALEPIVAARASARAAEGSTLSPALGGGIREGQRVPTPAFIAVRSRVGRISRRGPYHSEVWRIPDSRSICGDQPSAVSLETSRSRAEFRPALNHDRRTVT
jgi:hypothetical protein